MIASNSRNTLSLFPGIPSWIPLLAFILLTFLIGAAGYTTFEQYKKSITEEEVQNLGAIADLKVAQIAAWREVHRRRAEMFLQGSLLPDEVAQWLREGAPANERKQNILKVLAGIQRVQGYKTVSLLDQEGTTRISTNDAYTVDAVEKKLAVEAMRSQRVLFSDLHRGGREGNKIAIDCAAPLMATDRKKGAYIVGALLFEIDPDSFLYPMIQSWPTQSPSAETLLTRREGDDVLFLNEVRHKKGAALSLRIPLTNTQLPSVQALLHQAKNAEGVDYRGVPVVAAMRSIPDTPWIMVAKIDKAELFAPINTLQRWATGLVLAFAACGGALVFLWFKGHQARYAHLKVQHDAAVEREMLLKHFDYLTKYTNDIVLLVNAQGRIVEANDRAAAAYGYTKEQLKSMPLGDLLRPGADLRLKEIEIKQNLKFESVHIRKDGAAFPVENSMRAIIIEGERYYQAIIRDITDHKRAESALRKSETLLKESQQMAHIGSWELDLRNDILFWSDENFRIFEVDPALFDASYEAFLDAIHPDDRAMVDKAYTDSLKNRTPYIIVHRLLFPDQRVKFVQEWCETQYDQEGHPIRSIGTTQDITERKEAELKIHRLNNLYAAISRANEAIVLIRDRDMLLHEICRIAVEYGQFKLAWIGLVDDETSTVKIAASSGEAIGYLDSIHISLDADKPEGRGPVGMSIRDDREYICNDFLNDPRTLPWQESARKYELRASASCPLELEGQVVGALTLYAEETNYFDQELTNLLSDLSRDISLALDNFVREDRRKQVEEMLRRSEEHFRFLTENATDMVYRMSLPDGHYEYVSPASIKLFGYEPEEFYNSPALIRSVMPPDWHDYYEAQWAKLVTGEVPPFYEYPITHQSGDTRWMNQRNSPILDGSGKLIAIQAIVTDITERKQAEEMLWRQKNFIRQVIDTDPNLIFVKDAEGRFLLVNQAMADAYGKAPQELIGRNGAELYPNKAEAGPYLEADREVLATRHPVVLISPNSLGGKERWFLTIKTPMVQPDGTVHVLGIAMDITERKLAEERLGESYKELEKLTTHLEAVREDEQKRIARELHDEMGGVLAALNMKVSLMAAHPPTEMADLMTEVDTLAHLVTAGIQAMRRTVAELRPSLLDEVGLTFAIERYVQEFEKNTGIECDLRLPEEELTLDGNQSTAIFRIIQESLTNVAKHAKASRVSIVLSEWDTSLVLTVRDNGKGFDLNAQQAKSFGLLGIRERAAMVGGKAQITSAAGKGTTVRVSLPRIA